MLQLKVRLLQHPTPTQTRWSAFPTLSVSRESPLLQDSRRQGLQPTNARGELSRCSTTPTWADRYVSALCRSRCWTTQAASKDMVRPTVALIPNWHGITEGNRLWKHPGSPVEVPVAFGGDSQLYRCRINRFSPPVGGNSRPELSFAMLRQSGDFRWSCPGNGAPETISELVPGLSGSSQD